MEPGQLIIPALVLVLVAARIAGPKRLSNWTTGLRRWLSALAERGRERMIELWRREYFRVLRRLPSPAAKQLACLMALAPLFAIALRILRIAVLAPVLLARAILRITVELLRFGVLCVISVLIAKLLFLFHPRLPLVAYSVGLALTILVMIGYRVWPLYERENVSAAQTTAVAVIAVFASAVMFGLVCMEICIWNGTTFEGYTQPCIRVNGEAVRGFPYMQWVPGNTPPLTTCPAAKDIHHMSIEWSGMREWIPFGFQVLLEPLARGAPSAYNWMRISNIRPVGSGTEHLVFLYMLIADFVLVRAMWREIRWLLNNAARFLTGGTWPSHPSH